MTGDLHTFVFADLAGFTALAEAHGDERAADIAVELCRSVNRLLPKGGQDLKMIGDACLLRLDTVDQAVTLVVALTGELAARHGFPDVRVGMNTGPAARRGQEWFGRAINVAARVASQAGPGEVLLTEASFRLFTELPDVEMRDAGIRALRHVNEPVRLYRAQPTAVATDVSRWSMDPICHMSLDIAKAQSYLVHAGRSVHFCFSECAEIFAADPERYLTGPLV